MPFLHRNNGFSSSQDTPPATFCDVCRGEIYEDDLFHLIDGYAVCPECFYDYVFEYFSSCMLSGREFKEMINR